MCAVRALVYDTAAALLSRVGEAALAWTAADRALSAAEQSGQPALAASAWRMSYVIGSRSHLAGRSNWRCPQPPPWSGRCGQRTRTRSACTARCT